MRPDPVPSTGPGPLSGSGSAGGPGRPDGSGHPAGPGPVPDPRAARASVGEIEGLRDGLWSRGVAKVLLAGAGGVGVVTEVLAGPGARLTVLDGCDPVQLADALAGDLDATVLVISAPPGADTTAVELVWDTVSATFLADGLDPDDHTVLVAPVDHPLVGRAGGAPVVPGPAVLGAPEVGAWAAVTPYALVPAGLAGADVGALIGDALGLVGALRDSHRDDSPRDRADHDEGGADHGGGGEDIAERLRGTTGTVALTGPLAESIAQLLATLTLHRPLVVEQVGAPGWDDAVLTVGGPEADLPADGPVAAELMRWQQAVASLHARPGPTHGTVSPPVPARIRDERGDQVTLVVGSSVEVRTPWPVASFSDALAGLATGSVGGVDPGGVDPGGVDIAVHAHLDRHDDASAVLLRTELASHLGRLVAFGWGARTVPAAPAVLQITGAGPVGAAAVQQRAIAEAEAGELERHGVRVLRLHLTDRLVGLVELVRAIQDGAVHTGAPGSDPVA